MTDDTTPEGDRPRIGRRTALSTGVAALGGAALGAGLVAAETDSTRAAPGGEGGLDEGLDSAEHVFRLAASAPESFAGGELRGAHEGNFPVLTGQRGSVYLVRLEPGGVREPHWHPSAWELNYVVSGSAKWTVLGTHPGSGYRTDVFEAHQGDLVFAPQGFFHYFENAADIPLEVLIVFNTAAREAEDDIGIVAAFNAMPREVLAAAFGVPVSAFDRIPQDVRPVVVTRRS
ncbi:cupin domain-containing protein [Nocardia sp. alder85J]|uniref:cupin domain-containing protein n=1 Tax=Nocardia sp. alder85J TaxID=2862949 RepID=UPI001CD58D8F|nr:cupin domain-containing protein [Nocardia sp. alder85J]MCX4097981.1 cupin domain-containing protein [Nocardia sp. alder85J]